MTRAGKLDHTMRWTAWVVPRWTLHAVKMVTRPRGTFSPTTKKMASLKLCAARNFGLCFFDVLSFLIDCLLLSFFSFSVVVLCVSLIFFVNSFLFSFSFFDDVRTGEEAG